MNSKILLALIALSLSVTSVAIAMPDMKPAAEAVGQSVPISGKVLEFMNSSGYTYLLLDINGSREWVAVPEMYIENGDDIELHAGTQMGEFTSKPLGRTFSNIIFSAGPTARFLEKRKVSAHKGTDMTLPAPGKKVAGGKVVEGLKVDKAIGENAYTVAELFVKREDLQDKIIAVRGQVVKVSVGIMGRNWVHLMDGSGEKSNNKLVVTTKDEPNTGDIVTATGIFHNNVDFGGGYQYAVIMEDASIK